MTEPMTPERIKEIDDEINHRWDNPFSLYPIIDELIDEVKRVRADNAKLALTMQQAEFVVKVMDSIRQYPSLLADDIAVERKKIDVLYEQHGCFSEGALAARAIWLIEFLAARGPTKEGT